jgi:hypothetical protein
LVLLFPALALSQDWGGLHIVQGELGLSQKLTVQLHSRIRTNDDFSAYLQSRGGSILSYRWKPGIQWLAGYYFIDEEGVDFRTTNFHRAFGGAQYQLLRRKGFNLEGRTLTERFVTTRSGSFQRNRQRITLTIGEGQWRPYLQSEALVQRGIWVGRFGAGLQRMQRGGGSFSIGYEMRQSPHGGHMNLITTNLQFRLRQAKAD